MALAAPEEDTDNICTAIDTPSSFRVVKTPP